MRWEDERYVRLYTRDTADWMVLGWDAQALFMQLLRKVDRAGALRLGRQGKKSVAIVAGHIEAWPRIQAALDELIEDGCVCVSGEHLFIPNFLKAQEAVSSDAQRKRDQRERDRASLLKQVEEVTQRDEPSQGVTKSHEVSRAVTPSLAVPSLTKETLSVVQPTSGSDEEAGDAVRTVFDHWRVVMKKNRRTALDKTRKRFIGDALKNYPPEDLMLAIDGCARTAWNMGENPNRKRYDGLPLILKNADQIDRFIENAANPNAAQELVHLG